MGKGLGTRRRAHKRIGFAAVVITAVMGMAAPALGALVLNLDLTPARESVTVPNIVGVQNLTGGLAQTQTALTQLLTGLSDAEAVAAPFVQAHATEAAQTAIENLQARAEATAAAAAALDPATAQAELSGIATDLQGQALGEVAGLLPIALTTGLQVVQNIVTPLCSLTAIPSSFLPGVGLDTTRLWTAALPGIQQVDQATNQLLRDSWSNLYDQTLASVASIPTAGPIASALLLLLKYNWTTTYQPPTGPAIVTTTKSLMNVPTPIDVDHDGLFDLCGTTSFSIAGSGTSLTGLKVTQSLTKMPLAKPVLPVQASGGLLNVINFGYDTRESTVPIVYTSAATLSGTDLLIDNTYSVHRGTNLVIPPVSLAALNLTTLDLPTFPPIFTPAPKPIVTDEVCIGSCATLAIRDRFENVPASTHVVGPLASAGVKTTYSAPSTSDSYTHAFAVGTTITIGGSAGRDRPVGEVGNLVPIVSSAPTAFSTCLSISDGTCSPNSAAGDSFSSSFTSSSPTFAEQNFALTSPISTTCANIGSLSAAAHVNGTSMNTSYKKGAAAVGSGRIALDTAGKPIDGCLGVGSTLGLAGMPQMSFPVGTTATNRVATYQVANILTQPVPNTKTGAINCPTGTAISFSQILTTAQLAPVLCSLPPVSAVPTISGNPVVDATLTAVPGAWTPGAPNAPVFTYQWNRCNAAGTTCAPIAGGTNPTYTLDYGSYPSEPTDWHHKFSVTITGTNLDGAATATSAQTILVELPPPPTIAAAPVLSANRKVGVATTTTNGTYNNGATSFTYQWQRCNDAAATSCAVIGGATTSSYTILTADKGKWIRSGVIGTNHGGSAPINYSATAFIPGDPVNLTVPGIKNGLANAVGASVATGDTLTVNPAGTWSPEAGPYTPLTYRWQRCDAAGTPASCVDIAGATGASYTIQHGPDDGFTLRVVEEAHGLNGNGEKASGITGVVLFNDLAIKPVTQIPDGAVNATAGGAGTTTYVGGAFDTVGAPTGGSGLVPDSGAGSTVSLASQTAGAANGGVLATVPDGLGGYFMGGSFTQVKGIPCPALAHLQSDGSVDQSYCYSGLAGTVNALTRTSGAVAGSSKVLVVGGLFSLGGRNNLMFIDPANAANPIFTTGGDPNGEVRTVSANLSGTASSNNIVYLGGKFSQAGGTQAALLAANSLTWTGGQLTGVVRNNWSAGVCIGTPGPGTSACTDPAASVNTVASLSSGFVAIGGRFTSTFRVVNNATPTNASGRTNALLVGDNGAAPTLLGWNPAPNGPVNAIAIGPASGINNIPIYLGGDFTIVNGVAAKNLAEAGCNFVGGAAGSGANNNSGMMNTWLPNPNGPVTSLAYVGNTTSATLIVGGAFTTIDTRPTTATPFTTLVRHRLAKINIGGFSSATLPVVDGTWDPNAGRTVRTVSRDATLGTVTVGGDFLVLGGKTRNNLAEFDPNTGVTPWSPGTDGPVNAVAFRGGTVYAGGTFANAGGAARANVAAIDGTTGSATSWNPGANGVVNALATDATNVYVGGDFSTVGGQGRADLAAVDNSGAVTGWNPGTDTGNVKALAVNGGNVYVGGAFNQVGGVARSNVAAVDASGSTTGFDPNANAPVTAIAVNGAGVYLGGAFTSVGGQSRNHVALINPGTSLAEVWNPGVNGNVNAVFLIGNQVFVGGLFTTAGGASRTNLAALDATSDAALAFDPAPNRVVYAISRTPGPTGSIAVGGEFTIISLQAKPGLAFYGG
jgi:hypothetical protein